MDNSLFIKNILILIFCVILIHIFLNDFLDNKTCNNKDTFQNIEENQNNNSIIYLFYADWCGHCKHYKPIFNEFKSKMENKNIQFFDVNADANDEDLKKQGIKETKEELYKKFDVEGFPTTIIQCSGNTKKLVGGQTITVLLKEVQEIESFGDVEFNLENPDIFNNKINDNPNVINTNTTNNDTIVYNFNTTWCGHSKEFQPIWNKFSEIVKSYENVKAIDVKCDLEENINFCNQYKVKSVPSIIIVRNNELKPYDGSRTVEGLMNALQLTNNNKELDDKVKLDNDMKETQNEFMLLNNNDIKQTLNNETTVDSNIKTTVYNFNTEWCGYSRDFQPEWNIFVNSIKNSDGIRAYDVKCDNEQNKDLCKKYDIPGYPSVVIETENRVEIYNGPRNALALRKYLKL